jgi:hypothetical protein
VIFYVKNLQRVGRVNSLRLNVVGCGLSARESGQFIGKTSAERTLVTIDCDDDIRRSDIVAAIVATFLDGLIPDFADDRF